MRYTGQIVGNVTVLCDEEANYRWFIRNELLYIGHLNRDEIAAFPSMPEIPWRFFHVRTHKDIRGYRFHMLIELEQTIVRGFAQESDYKAMRRMALTRQVPHKMIANPRRDYDYLEYTPLNERRRPWI